MQEYRAWDQTRLKVTGDGEGLGTAHAGAVLLRSPLAVIDMTGTLDHVPPSDKERRPHRTFLSRKGYCFHPLGAWCWRTRREPGYLVLPVPPAKSPGIPEHLWIRRPSPRCRPTAATCSQSPAPPHGSRWGGGCPRGSGCAGSLVAHGAAPSHELITQSASPLGGRARRPCCSPLRLGVITAADVITSLPVASAVSLDLALSRRGKVIPGPTARLAHIRLVSAAGSGLPDGVSPAGPLVSPSARASLARTGPVVVRRVCFVSVPRRRLTRRRPATRPGPLAGGGSRPAGDRVSHSVVFPQPAEF